MPRFTQKQKQKQKKSHETDEAWLIPYADMLTLLLALFVVLFAMSEVDGKKFKKFSSAFHQQFTGGTGVLEHDAPIETPLGSSVADLQKKQKTAGEDAAYIQQVKNELQSLQTVQQRINAFITSKHYEQSLQTKLTENGLLITILDHALFDSGSAEVKKSAVKLGADLSQLLVTNPPRSITIAGHTDNIPIVTNRYQSNWELSAMRAINFMQILLENKQLSPKHLSASGYGEYRPTASNKTTNGQSKNRRVEVLILPKYNVKPNANVIK
ncbi:flagellar motor protein MotB [Fictibacillus macauensis ZFHKF-1]|uniref:Flagellar motor protein MotB n=1 Tax=Fictibacillus macauensis ZFHKF-1 TaxID=1196324 RepID=I8J220_9BACL|nr:flagellar motor protein MotB [Fictibacillus macauensis]EIT85796.1 flagellar motor protein MotB [Fictibacillus macauensis ZFHKF-1]